MGMDLVQQKRLEVSYTMERIYILYVTGYLWRGFIFSMLQGLYGKDYILYVTGSLWRGRDCHDGNSNIHPGRRPSNGDR